ncbi:MAG: hypothetical protein V6Z89_25560 [Desulfobacter sp.]
MKTKFKEFNNEKYEVLEHGETPGFKNIFHIVLCVAVVYFAYIFLH